MYGFYTVYTYMLVLSYNSPMSINYRLLTAAMKNMYLQNVYLIVYTVAVNCSSKK